MPCGALLSTSTINCSAIIGAESSFGTPQARSQVE
jgi:hypothetical protein